MPYREVASNPSAYIYQYNNDLSTLYIHFIVIIVESSKVNVIHVTWQFTSKHYKTTPKLQFLGMLMVI